MASGGGLAGNSGSSEDLESIEAGDGVSPESVDTHLGPWADTMSRQEQGNRTFRRSQSSM